MAVQALAGLALVAAIAVLLSSFVAFDKIVRLEYEEHRSAWEADGRPMGFFFRPEESTRFLSRLALDRLSLVWLVATPDWAQDSEDARSLFRRLRLSFLGWLLALAVLLPIGVRLTASN